MLSHVEVREALIEEFKSLTFLRSEFPMLANWGVLDYGETVHSLGLNYLTALGRSRGYWAVSEYPIVRGEGETPARDIRSDAVWFARPDGRVTMLAEFERYEPTPVKLAVLRSKAQNLVVAHHRLAQNARILLLAVWTTSGTVVRDLDSIRDHVRHGFIDDHGNRVASLPSDAGFLIVTFVLHAQESGLVLREVIV